MRDFNNDGILIGKPYQAVNEESEIQKYPIGLVYEAFGKRWRYCRAAATITPGKRGCPNLATSPWTGGDVTYGIGSDINTATGVLGGNYLDIITNVAHARTLDEFQDGIITLYPAAGIAIHQYRVIGNDVGVDTTHFRLYIDPPLAAAEVLTPCDISPSPYMNVGAPASVGTAFSVVVVPEILVTSGYFFWGQTRGPCWVTPNAGFTTASTRELEWHTNGTVKAAAGVALQRAGYLLHGNASDDDCHIMLLLE
jgi:hypothetical protein